MHNLNVSPVVLADDGITKIAVLAYSSGELKWQ